MSEDFGEEQAAGQPPADRPLLGLSILLIEDSKYFSEVIRRLSVRSGARFRRADSLASARKHLMMYKPDVVLVDFGLPDGSGGALVQELVERDEEAPRVIVVSGEENPSERKNALQIGARAVLSKPIEDLAVFQQIVASVLPRSEDRPRFHPRLTGTVVTGSHRALLDDLRTARQLLRAGLADDDLPRIDYSAQFLCSVALAAREAELLANAQTFSGELVQRVGWRSSAEALLNYLDKKLGGPDQAKAGSPSA